MRSLHGFSFFEKVRAVDIKEVEILSVFFTCWIAILSSISYLTLTTDYFQINMLNVAQQLIPIFSVKFIGFISLFSWFLVIFGTIIYFKQYLKFFILWISLSAIFWTMLSLIYLFFIPFSFASGISSIIAGTVWSILISYNPRRITLINSRSRTSNEP